jgi:lipoprotein-anchoring transpeptidase ErfK/SrfK
MTTPFHPRLFLLLAAASLLQACASLQPEKKPAPPATPAPPRESYWKGEGVKGPAAIVVDLSDQRAYFYKGDTVVGESRISSGKRGYETPPGEYKVIQKDKDHVSNLYGNFVDAAGAVVKANVDMSKDKVPEGATFAGSKMPYFLRFHRGYGLHAGRLPGRPASHGCVRLPRFMAAHFFAHASYGTPVIVQE